MCLSKQNPRALPEEHQYHVAILRGKMASWLRTRNTSV